MSRYTLLEKLGEGGMGAVYRAVQTDLNREVALKVLPASARDAESVARFHREIRLISQLQHPHIVRVYDSGEMDGQLFYTMEILRGRDLLQGGALPFQRATKLLEQAADALALMHERGLFHRDIKPANFVLSGDRLVLVDFGLATQTNATVLTEDGAVVGTLRFLSPEVLSAQPARGPADVYALALTAHELISGEPGFPNQDVQVMVAKILRGDRPTLAGRRGVPKWFLELQEQALAIDPQKRPSASTYRDLLRANALPSHVGAMLEPPPDVRPARRESQISTVVPGARRGLVPLVAAGALGVALLAAAALRPRAPVPEPSPSATPVVAPTMRADPGAVRDAARSFLCLPTDRSLFVDLEVRGPARFAVEVGQWATRAARSRVVLDAPDGYAQAHVEGLPQDTDHFVRVSLASGAPLIADYRVRTLTARHARTVAEMLEEVKLRPIEAGVWADTFSRTPDPRVIPPLVKAVRENHPDILQGFSKITWVARALRNRELSAALFQQIPKLDDPGTVAHVLTACAASRHPEGSKLALAKVVAADGHQWVQAGGDAAARIRGPDACAAVAEGLKRFPHAYPFAGALALADPECARAFAREALAPGKGLPIGFAGLVVLTELGDEQAVRELLAQVRARGLIADDAADALAAIGSDEARRALMAFGKESPGPAFLAAIARCGDEAAVPLVDPLRDRVEPAVRREAITALAACARGAATPALRRALGDADGEAATLAAWALAHVKSDAPGLVDEVLALARSPRDAGGLAALAAARMGGAKVADEVAKLLDEQVKAGASALRTLGVGMALAECGEAKHAEKLRAYAKERGIDAKVADALARAADRVQERAGEKDRTTIVVPASATWVRTGVRLAAGESVDVSAVGWFGLVDRPAAPWRPEASTQIEPVLPMMAVTAALGAERMRVGRKPVRMIAKRDGEVVLSPWVGAVGRGLEKRPGVGGYAIVTIGR